MPSTNKSNKESKDVATPKRVTKTKPYKPELSGAAIKRMTLKAGASRHAANMVPVFREMMDIDLREIIRIALLLCIHSRRKTVTTSDIKEANKRAKGRILYGFTD